MEFDYQWTSKDTGSRGTDIYLVKVSLPGHLKVLSNTNTVLEFEFTTPPTIRTVLDFLEAEYPELKGTTRDIVTKKRRPFIRFFFGEEDVSNLDIDVTFPDEIANGSKIFHIVGAMAGGQLTKINSRIVFPLLILLTSASYE